MTVTMVIPRNHVHVTTPHLPSEGLGREPNAQFHPQRYPSPGIRNPLSLFSCIYSLLAPSTALGRGVRLSEWRIPRIIRLGECIPIPAVGGTY